MLTVVKKELPQQEREYEAPSEPIPATGSHETVSQLLRLSEKSILEENGPGEGQKRHTTFFDIFLRDVRAKKAKEPGDRAVFCSGHCPGGPSLS